MKLNELEKTRYIRHTLLKEIGEKGVSTLRNSNILVIGAGGLGAPALYYLAAAGVGKIGIVDGDKVELSNLQRQIIHFTADLHAEKVISAANKIRQINPEVEVKIHDCYLTQENGKSIIQSYDYILECTDNYETKFLVNDLCVMNEKPFTHGSVLRFEGQCMTYLPGTACYRCLYPTPPVKGDIPTASQVGILGPIAGTIGTIQATEAIKYFTNIGELLTNRILLFDGLTMTIKTLQIHKDPECKLRHK